MYFRGEKEGIYIHSNKARKVILTKNPLKSANIMVVFSINPCIIDFYIGPYRVNFGKFIGLNFK